MSTTTKKLSLLALVAASAAFPAVASAARGDGRATDHWTKLAEVSADPRDGLDYVELNGPRVDRLVLRAREDEVTLHGVTIRFADGRVWRPRAVRFLAPGERLLIDLPAHRRIDTIVLDYGERHLRRRDRTPARLEIYGQADRARDRDERRDHYDRYDRDRERHDRYDSYDRDRLRGR